MPSANPRPARCPPHRSGVTPGDRLYYEPGCITCRELLAMGRRDGTEPRPPKGRQKPNARQRSVQDAWFAAASAAKRKGTPKQPLWPVWNGQ